MIQCVNCPWMAGPSSTEIQQETTWKTTVLDAADLQHLFVGQEVAEAFNHQDGVCSACHDQIQLALALLLENWVDDILAIDEPYSNSCHSLAERNICSHTQSFQQQTKTRPCIGFCFIDHHSSQTLPDNKLWPWRVTVSIGRADKESASQKSSYGLSITAADKPDTNLTCTVEDTLEFGLHHLHRVCAAW